MPKDSSAEQEFTERQLRVIAEIQRVAKMLGVDRLSQRDFDKYHELAGLSTAGYQFGSWNRAVCAAGLEPFEPHGVGIRKFTDDELLQAIVSLRKQLGKDPSEREMARFGNYSPKPFTDRWGTWVAAKQAAYDRYGIPAESGT